MDTLASYFSLRTYKEGDFICRKGDSGSTGLYVVVGGSVEVSVTVDESKVVLADLGESSYFGEISLVKEENARSADVIASSAETSLICLTATSWRALEKEKWYKRANKRLHLTANHRMGSFLQKVAFLKSVPSSSLDVLGGIFEMRSCTAGDVILREGHEPDGFYILSSGKVRITTNASNAVELTEESESNYFGEIALVERIPISATVTAVTDCMMMRLKPQAFTNFLRIVSSEVRAELRKAIKARAKHMLSAEVEDLVDPKWVAVSSELKD